MAVGYVLGQVGPDGVERPIVMGTKRCSGPMMGLDAVPCRALRGLLGMQEVPLCRRGRGHHGVLRRAVVDLLNGEPDLAVRINNSERKWLAELLDRWVRGRHRPGVDNGPSDALPRLAPAEVGRLAVGIAGGGWGETSL